MNIHPHDHTPNNLLTSRFGASWVVVLLMLASWLSSTAHVQAGCTIGDDYRNLHHGFLIPTFHPTSNNVLPSFTYQAMAWVYEDGKFEPIKNPLPLRCDGPGCRSNPLDGQWGQPVTYVDPARIVHVAVNRPYVPTAQTIAFCTFALNQDSPLIGESLTIDRPPKFS